MAPIVSVPPAACAALALGAMQNTVVRRTAGCTTGASFTTVHYSAQCTEHYSAVQWRGALQRRGALQ